jgi:ABC-type microcin C transport system permease subunit YejE
MGGAVTGALIGWIFGLFNWLNPVVAGLWLALDGLVFGAIVGAILGALSHWAQQGRRDFASVRMMLPERYEVIVDSEVADRAAELLHQHSPIRHSHTADF